MSSPSSADFTSADDPFSVFAAWFEEAKASEINDPETIILSTVDADGLPDSRAVLCKHFGPDGLVFYTNKESAKGQELAAHPKAAALFHWKSLRRQARFRGPVTSVSDSEADEYFHSRPRGSQIGAWASQQSRPLESRAALVLRVAELTAKFGVGPIPRPPYWGGYRLTPVAIEFWRDGAFRLHDRVRFLPTADGWRRERLYP